MKSIKKIRDYLLENRVDDEGDLDLRELDFSDFKGDVYIERMKVKGNLFQGCQEVQGNLHQDLQKAQGDLIQDFQEVQGDLSQGYQKVQGDLVQGCQKVKGNFYSRDNKAKGDIKEEPCEKWVETHTIIIDGKEIILSEESYNNLKESLLK